MAWKYAITFLLSINLLTDAFPNNRDDLSLPLINNMDAALTARIDMSKMNSAIKDYIGQVVREQVLVHLNDTVVELKSEVQTSLKEYDAKVTDHLDKFDYGRLGEFSEVKSVADKNKKDIQSVINQSQRTEERLRKVAVSGCVTQQRKESYGYIIKFDDIISQVGYHDISGFKTSGKFTAEYSGLYLVAVDIMSKTKNARVGIYKNGTYLREVYVASIYSNQWYSSAGVVAIELSKGDSIWIQTRDSMYIQSSKRSCVTIIKVG